MSRDGPGATRTFVRSPPAASHGRLLMAAGAAGIFASYAATPAAGLQGPGDPDWVRFVLPVPAVVGTLVLAAGWVRWTAPQRVEVGPDGLRVASPSGVTYRPWGDVGEAMVRRGRREVRVYDPSSQVLVQLDASFGDPDDIAAAINAAIAEHAMGPAKEADPAALQKQGRKQAVGQFVAAIMMLVLACLLAQAPHDRREVARLAFAEGGEPGDVATPLRAYARPAVAGLMALFFMASGLRAWFCRGRPRPSRGGSG